MKKSICLSAGVALAMATTSVLAQLGSAPKLGAWSPIRAVDASGKPLCGVSYSGNPKAVVTGQGIVFPVASDFGQVVVKAGPGLAPLTTRPATDAEKKARALIIQGEEFKRLMAGGAVLYELMKTPGSIAGLAAVEVSGAGLADSLKKAAAMCAPSHSTPTDPGGGGWTTSTNPTDPNSTTNTTTTTQSTQPATSIDAAICGPVLLGRMRNAKVPEATIVSYCHP